jgi:hypothetical protein
MAQSKFTISLLGFDERSAEFLGNETRKTMRIVDPVSKNETQVVVVDIDEPNSLTLWEEFRNDWPHMPAVITATDDPEIEDASFAEKPFTVEELIDCITEAIILSPAAEELSSQSEETTAEAEVLEPEPALEDFADTTAAPAINEAVEETTEAMDELELGSSTESVVEDEAEILPAAEPGPVDIEPDKEMPSLSEIAGGLKVGSTASSEILSAKSDFDITHDAFFDPDAYMVGLVLKGMENSEKTGEIAKLICLLDRTIYIDARNKRVKSNLRDIHMRQIAIAPLGEGDYGLNTQIEMVDASVFDELPENDGSIYPLETFVWELAILTSKGRAPVGTPMDKPVYLMQWPNFTRLMPIPNDMRVAAYWLRLPSSLADLSENLKVSMNDIFLLYSAASLTGLAGIARRKSDHLIKPGKPEEHKNRGLFGSIIDRLSKSSSG